MWYCVMDTKCVKLETSVRLAKFPGHALCGLGMRPVPGVYILYRSIHATHASKLCIPCLSSWSNVAQWALVQSSSQTCWSRTSRMGPPSSSQVTMATHQLHSSPWDSVRRTALWARPWPMFTVKLHMQHACVYYNTLQSLVYCTCFVKGLAGCEHSGTGSSADAGLLQYFQSNSSKFSCTSHMCVCVCASGAQLHFVVRTQVWQSLYSHNSSLPSPSLGRQPQELTCLGWLEESTHHLVPHIMSFLQMSRNVSALFIAKLICTSVMIIKKQIDAYT